jgi:hypothetical protein
MQIPAGLFGLSQPVLIKYLGQVVPAAGISYQQVLPSNFKRLGQSCSPCKFPK